MNKHDDLADALLYFKQGQALQEEYHPAVEQEKEAYRVGFKEISAGMMYCAEQEKVYVDILCQRAEDVILYRYDDINITLYVATLGANSYVLSKKGYDRVRRKIWSLRKSF